MRILLLLIGILLVGLCFAQTAPIITISFDKDFRGVTAAGPLVGQPDGKPELAPGKVGQALKSGPGTGYVGFPADLLKREAGTVEMWVQPLDWKPGDREFHVFFENRGEGALYLYKYLDGNNLLMLTCGAVAGPYYSTAYGLSWQPGEWHHIAGTWSNAGVRVFVDGKPSGPMPTAGPLPEKLAPTFIIGDHPWHIERQTSSLIDEVRLYDRALSPAHIAAHAAGNYNFVALLTAQQALMGYELDPVKGEVLVRFSTGGADVPDEQVRVRVGLVPKGQPLGDAPEQKVVGGEVTATLPLDVTKPAQFEVVAQVVQQGTQAFEVRKGLVVPDMTAWRGNKLGLEDVVVPPWSPVKVVGQNVSVWDRVYDFSGHMSLVEQISSGGHALLAAPIRLYGVLADDPVIFTASGKATVSASPTRATVVRELLSDGTGPAKLTAKVTTEYDGLVLIELSGKLPANLKRLSIDIPLRPEIAMYRHRYSPEWDSGKHTGLLPKAVNTGMVTGLGEIVDKDRFIPYYWLGNNDRGLFWFCESDEMWPNGQNADAVQVQRGGGLHRLGQEPVTLRLNILAKGQKLPANWKFAFGLQATPVKPMPKDWRKWRMDPGRNPNISIMWPTPQKDSIRYFGYPEATDAALHTERIKKLHEQGIRAVPYLCLSFLSAACPEWPYFQKYWGMGPVDASSSDVAAYGVGFAMVSPVGRDYSDFIVWKTAQFIKQYGIDGLYHDNTHPYFSTNLDAGCGYVRDGKVVPTYPILGFRALYRRMYAVLKRGPKETFSMAHMSGKMTIPILAYEDSTLDGEHFRAKVKDSYMDMMGLDTFRAEYMGRQWGIMPYFLPEFDQEHAAQVEPTRGLMALLMLHDTAVWPIWCNAAVANEALAALDEFGYVGANFIGYFDSPSPATTDMKDVYVSAYRKGARTLLIVGNVSREDRQGSVTLNAPCFGAKVPTQAQDWPAKTPLTLTAGKLSLSVPRLGYRLVLVE